MKAEITGGHVSDYKGYDPVMEGGRHPKVLLADRGCNAVRIREDVHARGGTVVLPMRNGRKAQIPIEDFVYALRNMVERCINRLKNVRRVATRYDKTAASYLGFLHIVSIRVWAKNFVNRA